MIVTPSIEQVREISRSGKYTCVPVKCEILSDICTPIQAVKKLKKVSKHTFLLESVEENKRWGRYTFLGYEPKCEITCINGRLNINYSNGEKREEFTPNPEGSIREILGEYRSPTLSDFPSFTGGLVGYFSYDYLNYSEPTTKADLNDEENFKDVDLMLFDSCFAFDNFKQKIIIITNVMLNTPSLDIAYNDAVDKLKEMRDIIVNGKQIVEQEGRLIGETTALFNKNEYCEMVEKAKKHIFEGDIFQIVLSNRLSAPFEGTLLDTYRRLRTINPSPYMFYFSGTDVELAGASPETLVKLEYENTDNDRRIGVLHTFPLAGTRPRGKTDEQDKQNEIELLADEKELAEHNMLVDLGRNDLGKLSKFGTVEVEKYHCIERYSHVMHIGSTVRGEIKDNMDALDAVSAVLPAGTLSGAPKIRACQLINELENNKRGVYGGAVGYIDFAGNLDTCIAIRLAFKKNGTVFVRSGAGIVADSVPEKEYTECINKAAAVVNALQNTEDDV